MHIVGHQKIINFLDKSVAKGKISHAYLFSGPAHTGKFTVAKFFAQKIAGEGNQKINPDIIIVSPEEGAETKKKSISVGDIRDLQHQLNLSAYHGKYKVAIIDEADSLTISAQNAMLKTLEEPPENCVLILVCHREEKMLETVKSRCVIKKFSLVDKAEIAELIGPKDAKEEIIFWSFGRPGLAVNMQNDAAELAKRKEAKKSFEKIIKANINDRIIFAESLSKAPLDLSDIFGYWSALLRENVLGGNVFPEISREKSFHLIGSIGKSANIVRETNSNVKLALENLFINF
jgi:DNA polymerase-3 subunit delta'